MPGILQWIIMAALVLVAAGYVIWTFMSLPRRQRLLDRLAAHHLLVDVAARHRARLATPGCSRCSASTRTLHNPVRK